MTAHVRRLALLGLFLVAASLALRDATPATARVVAIGDVHGDFNAFVRVLQHAGLVDADRNWAGGRTVLVQTGDFLDRGPRVRAVMDLLRSLQAAAPKTGGQVHVLMGNHEGMNVLRITRDVSRESLADFADGDSERRRNEQYDKAAAFATSQSAKYVKPVPLYRVPDRAQWMAEHPAGLLEYLDALGPDGSYGQWLRSLPAAVKIDDTIFMHTGVNPASAPDRLDDVTKELRREISRWDDLRAALIAGGYANTTFTTDQVIAAAQIARLVERDNSRWNGDNVPAQSWVLLDPEGPLWFRGLATGAHQDLEGPLTSVLQRYGARRFVIGHSVMANGRIGQRFDGRVLLIDTGMLSSFFRGGRGSALEILDGHLGAIYEDGKRAVGSGTDMKP